MNAGRTERGLALVSVLWGVAILSVIAAAMLSASLTGAYIGRNSWNSTRGASLDEAAINRAILSLMDPRAQNQPRLDGTPNTIRFDRTAVRVWIQDESGRINLNFAAKDVLESLFVSAGVDRDGAAALADRVIARRAPRDAASRAPIVAFRRIDELLAVPGVSARLYSRVLAAVTVYGRDGAVNKNVAPRQVLLALPDMDANAVASLLRDREAARAANPPAAALAAPNKVFAIAAEARIDGARTVRIAVVQFTGDATKPFWFLSWQS